MGGAVVPGLTENAHHSRPLPPKTDSDEHEQRWVNKTPGSTGGNTIESSLGQSNSGTKLVCP